MEDFKKIESNFEDNIAKITLLQESPFIIGKLAMELLGSLESEAGQVPACLDVKKKLSRTIKEIDKLKEHSEIKEQFSIIYNQSLVLLISHFESLMTDLFVCIIDNYPFLLKWPEKKKISIDVDILRYSSPTVGALVCKSFKGEINFQDLQSTIKFLNEFLCLEISLEETIKGKIILFQALRHIIIHNNAIVDEQFLRQIRDNKSRRGYSSEQKVLISLEQFDEAKKIFLDFKKEIMNSLQLHYKKYLNEHPTNY
ncbi:MAG: hypothetical protein WC711_04325 [Candidatus Staskawiczbacteria bacterium]|jgi:hypothetical protein